VLWQRDRRWLSRYAGWAHRGSEARPDAGQARPGNTGSCAAGHSSSAISTAVVSASTPAEEEEAGSISEDSTVSTHQAAVQRYPDYIAWAAAQSDLGREKRLLNLYRAGLVRLTLRPWSLSTPVADLAFSVSSHV